MEKYVNYATELLEKYGLKILLAIVVLIIGLWLIKVASRLFLKFLAKRDIDPSLKSFLKSFISITLKLLLIVTVVGMAGVETSAFIAIFASVGIGIGMAMSGTLQNVAGGIFILFLKPYTIGHFIKVSGEMGTVKEIHVFNTILNTTDNKVIIIPNAQILNGVVTNFSKEQFRRVDLTFGIGYNDDIDKAKALIMGLINDDKRVLKEPAEPFVMVGNLGDSSVDFTVRLWVDAADYWGVFFDLTENVKKTFDANGVSIPFPQTDVHLYQEKA
ncbi:mechanosensitive ion channel family protein, partial [Bacteroidota bacterium]